MHPAVSVILPVYNVESCLARAIDSILGQTLRDIELILVDDGSPDGCGAICDGYAARDRRVIVLHQSNRGAFAARNAAMEIACGKYFFFCDGDDWAQPEMLADLYALAERSSAELVVAGFTIDTYGRGGRMLRETLFAPDALYETPGAFRQAATTLFDRNLLYTPWNKLYGACRIRALGLRFPDTFWDDFPFNLAYLKDVGRVAVTSRAYYHFTRSRAESETARYIPRVYEKREQEDQWLREMYAYWGLADAESREFLARRYAERLLGCVENLTNPRCTLSLREKQAAIADMLRTPRAREALALAKPETFLLRTALRPLKTGSVWRTYWQSVAISLVKRRFGLVFAWLKSARGKAEKARK